MVEKFTTDEGLVDKTRPPGCNYDRVRSEVGDSESGNTGNFPKSDIKFTTDNVEDICIEVSVIHKNIYGSVPE